MSGTPSYYCDNCRRFITGYIDDHRCKEERVLSKEYICNNCGTEFIGGNDPESQECPEYFEMDCDPTCENANEQGMLGGESGR